MYKFLKKDELLSFAIACDFSLGIDKMKEAHLEKKSERKKMGEEYFDCKKLDISWTELPDKKINGHFTAFYLDGKKAAEGNFVDGKLEGKYLIWFPSGKIMSEIEFLDGKMHGYSTRWLENGFFLFRNTFVGGKIMDTEKILYVHRMKETNIFSAKGGFWISKTFTREGQILHVYEQKLCDVLCEKKIIIPLFEIKADFHKAFGIIKSYYPNSVQMSVYSEYSIESDDFLMKPVYRTGWDRNGNVI